jgi:hypothetical protein
VNKQVKTLKNMKKYTAVIAAIAASALSFSAQATLTGTFGFSGSADTDGTAWGNPLTFVDLTAASMANNNTGSYAAIDNLATTFINPVNVQVGAPSFEVFTVTLGVDTWAFYSTAVLQSGYNPSLSSQYAVAGLGLMTEWDGATLLDQSAAGVWTLGINNTGGSFTFAGTGGGTIPDGGMTITLLGGALIALQAIRRKLGC